MKITFEISDPTPAPEAESTPEKAATPTPAPAPPIAEKQPKAIEAKPSQPVVNKEKASQPSASSNSLHSFDLQGGVNNISDPRKSDPSVFQFTPPKEGA